MEESTQFIIIYSIAVSLFSIGVVYILMTSLPAGWNEIISLLYLMTVIMFILIFYIESINEEKGS